MYPQASVAAPRPPEDEDDVLRSLRCARGQRRNAGGRRVGRRPNCRRTPYGGVPRDVARPAEQPRIGRNERRLDGWWHGRLAPAAHIAARGRVGSYWGRVGDEGDSEPAASEERGEGEGRKETATRVPVPPLDRPANCGAFLRDVVGRETVKIAAALIQDLTR